MADVKISDLPLATTPLTGSEYTPIVQGGVTSKVTITNAAPVRSVNTKTGVVTLNTDDVAEGTTNEYYTDARARASISATQNLTYNNTTGVITGPDLSTYLQDGDVGVVVQPYDSGTVIDSGYVHTDNNYTTTEKNKLNGIEDNADVTDAINVAAAGAIMDGDFTSNGLMKRTGSGTYTVITDNSSNWDTAYSWGDHATAGYLDSTDIGVLVQGYDADLTSWAAIAPTAKQDTLVSGTNIKTINSNSLLGSGDIVVGGVSSVAMSVPTGLSVSGSPITSSGTLAVSFSSGYSIPTTTKQSEWDSAYTDRLKWDGGATGLNATTGRTSLGLGSAATTSSSDYATAAQGTKADSALQPSDIGISVQAYDSDLTIWAGKTAPTGTVVGTSDTQTVTNKRVTQRIGTIADAATITPTGDSSDQYNVTALAQAATIAAPSGTPTDGQKLVLRLKDNGTNRALTWTTSSGGYRAIGVTLPTTTTASKVTYIGCIYNSQDSYWDVLAVTTQA